MPFTIFNATLSFKKYGYYFIVFFKFSLLNRGYNNINIPIKMAIKLKNCDGDKPGIKAPRASSRINSIRKRKIP